MLVRKKMCFQQNRFKLTFWASDSVHGGEMKTRGFGCRLVKLWQGRQLGREKKTRKQNRKYPRHRTERERGREGVGEREGGGAWPHLHGVTALLLTPLLKDSGFVTSSSTTNHSLCVWWGSTTGAWTQEGTWTGVGVGLLMSRAFFLLFIDWGFNDENISCTTVGDGEPAHTRGWWVISPSHRCGS